MTIREAIDDLLAGRGIERDPGAVLEGHGFGDLPAEALSSALAHYAASATLEVADALAPLVTRLSDVPFAAGDLPPADDVEEVLAGGGDVFELLSRFEPATIDVDELDPSDLDLDLGELADVAGDAGLDEAGVSAAAEAARNEALDAFGRGEAERDPGDDADHDASAGDGPSDGSELPDLPDLPDTDEVEEQLVEVADSLLGELGELGRTVAERADDIDPDDLDFDLD